MEFPLLSSGMAGRVARQGEPPLGLMDVLIAPSAGGFRENLP